MEPMETPPKSATVTAPLFEWAWQNASLPVSLGGLGLQMAISYASAAFVGSLSQSNISAAILNRIPASSSLDMAHSLLAVAANRLNWSDIKDIDLPIQQQQFSRAIDQASFDLLLQDASDTIPRPWHYLPLSVMLVHEWLNVVPCPALGLHLLDWEFC